MTPERMNAEKEIAELMGFIPDFYKALPDSAFTQVWQLQKQMELGETVLEFKTKELIGLAVASHMKCKYCVYFHSRAAETFGATKEEIREAALMGGMTAMMSNVVTGSQVDFETFKVQVDQALSYLASHIEGRPSASEAPPLQ